MNETAIAIIRAIIQWCSNHIVAILFILSIFFEVSKIKIYPVSWLMKLLYRPLNKDMADMKNELNENMASMEKRLSDEIDSIKDKVNDEHNRIDDLIASTELSEISRIRWNIIEFSNSIDNGQKHIRDEYRHIKDESKRYHNLIKKYGLDNGIIDEEMEKIDKRYEENRTSSAVYF